MAAGVFLSRRDSLKHQHQGAPRRAHIDRLEARVQHQHGPMQALLLRMGENLCGAHARPPAVNAAVNERSTADRRSVRANASSATCAAPARFKARAQALAVAPVVTTSSTSNTRIPSSGLRLLK